ncbi:MAG: hypothetical protein IKG62_06490 [Lachnospiraceae bacterium]|nr:hypothetical protein [Lachnospiraceae bacterium]
MSKQDITEAVLAAVRDITRERMEAGIFPYHAPRLEVRRRVPMTDKELTDILRYLRRKMVPLKVGRTINDGYISIKKNEK